MGCDTVNKHGLRVRVNLLNPALRVWGTSATNYFGLIKSRITWGKNEAIILQFIIHKSCGKKRSNNTIYMNPVNRCCRCRRIPLCIGIPVFCKSNKKHIKAELLLWVTVDFIIIQSHCWFRISFTCYTQCNVMNLYWVMFSDDRDTLSKHIL